MTGVGITDNILLHLYCDLSSSVNMCILVTNGIVFMENYIDICNVSTEYKI